MKLDFDTKKLAAIAKRHGLKFVILHGSYATGRSRSDSDADIALLADNKLSFTDYSRLHSELADLFEEFPHRELDLKDIYSADPFFRYEVVREGKLLYGNTTEYEEFKAGAFHAYEDAKPLFELEKTLIHKYQQHLNKLVAQYA